MSIWRAVGGYVHILDNHSVKFNTEEVNRATDNAKASLKKEIEEEEQHV